MAGSTASSTVCVTGASGFLASHVVRELLERGYRVRGTVRDPLDGSRTDHLRRLARDEPGRLELVGADLLQEHAFDEAVAGCELVVHCASPLLMRARDPQRDIVDPAVRGTRSVLEAAHRAGGVRRIVLTSSMAAIRDERRPADHLHSERDWNESATLRDSPYPHAKTMAERAAWASWAALPEDHRFELVALNPTMVLGPILAPIHAEGSVTTVRELLSGRWPGVPNLQVSIVDVRDVAFAHVAALERPAVSGRYILFHRALWVAEIAEVLAQELPGRRIPRRRLPDWLVYAGALLSGRVSVPYLRANLGVARRIDNSRGRNELGIEYRPVEQTVVDTARGLLERGLV